MRHFVELSLATVRAMHARGPLIYSAVHSLLLAELHGRPGVPVCVRKERERQCQVFPPAKRYNTVGITYASLTFAYFAGFALQVAKTTAVPTSQTPQQQPEINPILVRHSRMTTTEASSRAVSGDNRLGRQLNENYTLRLRTERRRRVVFCCCTARPVLFFLSMYAVCYSHPLYNLPAIRRMNPTLSDGREWAGTNESIFTENGHTHTQARVLVGTKTKRRHKWMNIWYGFGAGCCVWL